MVSCITSSPDFVIAVKLILIVIIICAVLLRLLALQKDKVGCLFKACSAQIGKNEQSEMKLHSSLSLSTKINASF